MFHSELLMRKKMQMTKKIYLYPKWTRSWHVLNALLFLVLIFTGISMQYAGRETGSSPIRFDQAVKWHNIAAIILVVNYGFFVIGNAVSRNGNYYRIKREGFLRDLAIQFRYYAYGMFRNEKHPFEVNEENKFNPLQKISYVVVIYIFMPFIILSGIALLFPEIIDTLTEDLFFHKLCTYLYNLTCAFSIFHKRCRCMNFNDQKELINVNVNRIIICQLTKSVLEKCFGILGLQVIEKM